MVTDVGQSQSGEIRVRSRIRWGVLVGMVVWIYVSTSLEAASVSLAWDRPTTNADGTQLTDLTAYRLYHGLASGVYTDRLSVTSATSATFSNIPSGCSNYFAVTAVNSSGVESDFSREAVVYVPPAICISTNVLSVPESGLATFLVTLDAQPAGVTTVLVSRLSGGNPCFGAVSGTTLCFSPSNWASNRTVTIAALYDPLKTNRTAFFQLSGSGLSGSMICVVSAGAEPSATEITDGNDADRNGIPDAWEITRFGGIGIQGLAADDDPDHDGFSNAQEYIAGTDPADPASRPLIDIRTIGGGTEVSFRALEAAGPGYVGKSRYYTLEQCTNLTGGVWEKMSSAAEITGRNQTFSYSPAPLSTGDCFYRVRVRLQ